MSALDVQKAQTGLSPGLWSQPQVTLMDHPELLSFEDKGWGGADIFPVWHAS